MTVKYDVHSTCDRCLFEDHTEGTPRRIESEIRDIPDDWGRISDKDHQTLDLCAECYKSFEIFMGRHG